MCYQNISKKSHYAVPFAMVVLTTLCASHLISRKSKKDHTEPINFKLFSGVIRKHVSSLLNILNKRFNPFLQRENNKTHE